MTRVTTSDTTQKENADTQQRLSELERGLQYPNKIVTNPSGSIVTSSSAAVSLTSGPSLIIPASGRWEIGLSVFMQSQAEGLTGMESLILKNGTSIGLWLYMVSYKTFEGGTVYRALPAEFIAKDVLTVAVSTSAKISTSFSNAVIGAQVAA